MGSSFKKLTFGGGELIAKSEQTVAPTPLAQAICEPGLSESCPQPEIDTIDG